MQCLPASSQAGQLGRQLVPLPVRRQQCTGRRATRCRARGREERRGPLHQKLASTTVTVVPQELLRSDYAEKQVHSDIPLTVYSCRLSTGYGRNAALSDAASGVNLCLIGKNGRSVMHRISSVNDPDEAKHDVELMCQIIDDETVGADCVSSVSPTSSAPGSAQATGKEQSASSSSSSSSSSYTLPPKPPPAPRLRFQEGQVDELVFLAPELGPLAGVLVGTEHATWMLEELQVSSSRTHHIDRFVCRQMLGSIPGQGACFLTPVPPGAVVYGEGDKQVILSKEQATTLHAMNMDAYEALKQRLLSTTFVLTASGTWVAGLAAGLEGAIPFALGGMMGVTYQWLLQQSVDSIVTTAAPGHRHNHVHMSAPERTLQGSSVAYQEPSLLSELGRSSKMIRMVDTEGLVHVQQPGPLPGSTLRKILSGPAARVVFLGAATALAVTVLCAPQEGAFSPMPLPIYREQMWKLLTALLGFMTYKLALISVTLSQPDTAMESVKAAAGPGSAGSQR